ncbi:MAG TPA: hypothetical protein VH540_09940 [Ktedonobacterales bacterium]|jgi:hypothetical protein
MDEMRYRKPSVRALVGATKWKKRIKKALGITAIMRPFRALPNFKRRMLRRVGYYSPGMKMVRAAQRGQVPGPIGPIQVGSPDEKGHESGGGKLLMAAALAGGLSKRQKKGRKSDPGVAPHLAEAMLLGAALKGKHKEQAESEGQAAEDGEPEPPAHQQARRKRHRGARLFGLLLTALLTALAILMFWFFFLA